MKPEEVAEEIIDYLFTADLDIQVNCDRCGEEGYHEKETHEQKIKTIVKLMEELE